MKDVDPDRRQLVVRDGKGDRDRRAPFPVRLRAPLQLHLERVRTLHERDRARDIGPWIPGALFRHHLHETTLQRSVMQAASAAKIPKRDTHVLDRGSLGVTSPADRL